MKPPARKKAAPPSRIEGTAVEKSEHRKDTQSTTKRQPQLRFGQVTASDLVPLVMAEFDHLAADPMVDRAPRRRKTEESRLLSILDQLDEEGGLS